MTEDERIAILVALKLNPPPDGIYDDELTQARYHCFRGRCVSVMSRSQVDETQDKATQHMQRPWGTYRMLP